jgi:serine/threonine protein kinase
MWKIGDFGFTANFVSQSTQFSQDARATMYYRAPELLSIPARVTRKTDIWALGCIFYEVITDNFAFMQGSTSIKDYIHSGEPLEIPLLPFEKAECMFMADLVHDLLAVQPADRPDATSVFDTLAKGPTTSISKGVPRWITQDENRLWAVAQIGRGEAGEIYKVTFHV